MTITLNGTSGINTPGVVNTAAGTVATTLAVTGAATLSSTLAVTGVSTLTGGFTVGATAAPAFSASLSANQTVTTATTTKVTFNTEQFDTNSNYDNATNYRFTPTVAGYYQINVALDVADVGAGTQNVLLRLYKNGAQYLAPIRLQAVTGNEIGIVTAQLVSMNGSTDYLEVYLQVTAATNCYVYSTSNFSGSMVRSA